MAGTKAAEGKEPEGRKTVRVTQVASAAGRFADFVGETKEQWIAKRDLDIH